MWLLVDAGGEWLRYVMPQAQVLLNPTPAIQDIPNFDSSESGYTFERNETKRADNDSVTARFKRIATRIP